MKWIYYKQIDIIDDYFFLEKMKILWKWNNDISEYVIYFLDLLLIVFLDLFFQNDYKMKKLKKEKENKIK